MYTARELVVEHLQALKKLESAILASKYNVHSFVPKLSTFDQDECFKGNQ